MKVCPECGTKSNTQFCPECGNEMMEADNLSLESASPRLEDVKQCPQCGYEGTVAYCPECGSEMMRKEQAASSTHALSQNEIKQEATPQHFGRRKKNLIVAGAVLVVVIIAAVIGFGGNKDDSTKSKRAYNATTETSSYSESDITSNDDYASDYGPTLSGSWHCIGAYLSSGEVLTTSQMASAGFDVSISLLMYSDNTYSMTGYLETTTDGTSLNSTGAYVFDGDRIVFTDDRTGRVLGIGGYVEEDNEIMITFSDSPSESDMYLILGQ